MGVLLFAQVFLVGNVDSSSQISTGYATYTPSSRERAASINKQIAENNKKIAELERKRDDIYYNPETGMPWSINPNPLSPGLITQYMDQIESLKAQNAELTTQLFNILIEDMNRVATQPSKPYLPNPFRR